MIYFYLCSLLHKEIQEIIEVRVNIKNIKVLYNIIKYNNMNI